jgi:hypothetical protein
MNRFDVEYLTWGSRETAFFGRGEMTLFDTCLVASGPLLRFRIPLLTSFMRRLLTIPSLRTIPYGVILKYRVSMTLPQHLGFSNPFEKTHVITYRLPSRKRVKLAFRVVGGGPPERVLQRQLERNLSTTKEMIVG